MTTERSRRSTRRTTMTEVARVAEVSPSTVSLFLRSPDSVSARKRGRIQHAIDSLRYVPNRMAGSLAAASTNVIGVIVPSLVNSFFADTVSALQDHLMAEGYQILIGHTDYDLSREEELVRTFLSWSPSGIVLTGLGHSRGTRQMLEASDIPVVEMWETGPHPIDMMVGFSHADVGRSQARHLVDRGCRNIAFIGARLGQDARAAQRGQGYRDVLQAHSGLAAPDIVDAPAQTSSAGAVAFGELAARRPDLDGVVFSNDILALGALMEARRQNLPVPEQIKMIGFGGVDFTSDLVTGLSTIAPPRRLIGERAAELIIASIRGQEFERYVTVASETFHRQTSASTDAANPSEGPEVSSQSSAPRL